MDAGEGSVTVMDAIKRRLNDVIGCWERLGHVGAWIAGAVVLIFHVNHSECRVQGRRKTGIEGEALPGRQ